MQTFILLPLHQDKMLRKQTESHVASTLMLRPSVGDRSALVFCHLIYMSVAQHCTSTSHRSLSPVLQVSDRGGGVPFRRIENLFSYMYSTAPAPQIGDHTRPPLVSRDVIRERCGGLPSLHF